ncbi:glycosyltransferase family 4 protein [Filimonas effusa]|uniref:Glycosyltransferase family 1 protein n=1 Tax=Filimonas effusa TaxID=2508721 RepID=A0A4Q1D1B6_9BACT|nr:glycosyltransferase family 1 protein [Filimonas effusa]RXK80881.1 glycosyltransferase family 1 protein [Filimonas effusa]
MPKILFTADQMATPSTGLYHFSLELIKEIQKAVQEDYSLHYLVPRQLRNSNLFGPGTYRTKSGYNRIKWKVKKEFDIIHFLHQTPAILKPHKVIGKKILTVHDLNYLYEYPSFSGHYRHFDNWVKNTIKHCDQIVAISNFTAMDIARHIDYPASKIKVIYNGVSFPDFPENILQVHRPAYQPTRPFLFTVGTVYFKKNFYVLPAMLKYLDIDLIIAGRIDDHSINYYSLIGKEMERFNISKDRVKLLGEISELDKHWYYRNCEGFVFPSFAEGFGLPVLEAMNHNKPLFLSKDTALPEIGGDIAYYFPSMDPEEMAKTVSEGLSNYPGSGKDKQIPAWLELFSWKKAAREYIDVYKKILSE